MTFSVLDLVLLVALGLAVALLLAPLQAFALWAGWGRSLPHPLAPTALEAAESSGRPPERYLVFLDGISKGSYRDTGYITDFLAALHRALPDSRIISDVLPYSVFDLELTSRTYFFSYFWIWVEARKAAGNPLGYLINLRNLLQVVVSADWRYGPLYNVGMTKLILQHLLRHGYKPHLPGKTGRAVPIILVGYSGGGQVAAGAAPLLAKALKSPVTVISIAGVMAGNADFDHIQRWVQIMSNRDPVEKLGAVMFPLRWRVAWRSSWNRAKRQKRVTLVRLDGARHDGQGSYMDKRASSGDTSWLEQTVAVVARAAQES